MSSASGEGLSYFGAVLVQKQRWALRGEGEPGELAGRESRVGRGELVGGRRQHVHGECRAARSGAGGRGGGEQARSGQQSPGTLVEVGERRAGSL